MEEKQQLSKELRHMHRGDTALPCWNPLRCTLKPRWLGQGWPHYRAPWHLAGDWLQERRPPLPAGRLCQRAQSGLHPAAGRSWQPCQPFKCSKAYLGSWAPRVSDWGPRRASASSWVQRSALLKPQKEESPRRHWQEYCCLAIWANSGDSVVGAHSKWADFQVTARIGLSEI